MKKIVTLLLVFALVLGMSSSIWAMDGEVVNNEYDIERYGDVLDIGTKLRVLENDEAYIDTIDQKIVEDASNYSFSEESTNSADSSENDTTAIGETKYFLNIEYSFKKFTLRSIGENVEIWVAQDLSFPEGDPRLPHVVTQEQIDRLRDEFDSNMYPIDTAFFGTPDSHTGENATITSMVGLPADYYTSSDGQERVILLVDNIPDDNYYDPDYPFFIAGFYSSAFEGYFDRNIINIDSNNWEERLESTFYGTTTHEFQHLIHDDNDSEEESWINEGMSTFAEYLCGYGHPMGHINFFLDHPENSLVDWDEHRYAETGPETLADYGQVYLLQLYLNDHYGQDFIQALAKSETEGIAGVNEVLEQFNTGIDFEELFRRFSISLAIDEESSNSGIYGFDSIDLQVNYESALYYEKDGVPAWGANYKIIDTTDKIKSILFDGYEFLPIPWKVVDDPLGTSEKVLWGNDGDERANQIILEANLTTVEEATLKFDNYIDIEEHWDFGIVQVSTDGGSTWTSLANENTTSDIVEQGYPDIKENLPGFTGYYDSWQNEIFDLTPFVGQKILINFNYMTDWGYNDSGWYIDNIEIPEIGYLNDCSSIEGFKNINAINGQYVEYAVSFINEKTIGQGELEYKVVSVDPFNVNEEDALELRQLFKDGNNYMVIWYAAPEGVKDSVEFTYEIIPKLKSDK